MEAGREIHHINWGLSHQRVPAERSVKGQTDALDAEQIGFRKEKLKKLKLNEVERLAWTGRLEVMRVVSPIPTTPDHTITLLTINKVDEVTLT